MAVTNAEIAGIFDEVADLLEISGADFFRVRAYRNASRVIKDLSTQVATIAADPEARLEDLPGIGKDLAGSRIREVTDCSVVAIRYGAAMTINPDPHVTIREGDELILIGTDEGELKFLQAFES